MIKRNKFDLYELANLMLDHLPQSVFKSDKTIFLDPAMGGGQFCHAVENRLREYGHSDENISKRVYGFESVIMDIRFAVNKYKLIGQYSIVKPMTFLEQETLVVDPKDLIIVGNPPFQQDADKAQGCKRWPLWHKFADKAVEMADIVAFVTPQSITSPGVFEKINQDVSVISVDVSKYFDVGSTFSYWITDKNKSGKAKVITDADEFDLDLTKQDFLPGIINKDTIKMIKWLQKRDSREWQRGEMHTSRKERFHDNGKYEVFHTNAQTLRSNYEHENLDKVRVVVTLSGYPEFKVIKGAYCSQSTYWTEFKTLKEAREFAKECNGEFIQEIMSIFKWNGWNSPNIIKML